MPMAGAVGHAKICLAHLQHGAATSGDADSKRWLWGPPCTWLMEGGVVVLGVLSRAVRTVAL